MCVPVVYKQGYKRSKELERNTYTRLKMLMKKPSKVVQALGTKIEQESGIKINFEKGTTAPVEEWIPETKMAASKAINLRTAAETKREDGVIKLKQFNPTFFLVGENVPCRVPGCSVTTPRLKPSNDSYIKQDLFLCDFHCTMLVNLVSKRCDEEGISVSTASFKHEYFHGYTYLIGELEKAFMHLIKKPGTLNMPNGIPNVYFNSDLLLAEVFLNSRNFLTITQTLLNPEGDNVGAALPGWFVMLDRIMNNHAQSDSLERLVRALRDIIDIVLNFFGVIYAWVRLDNPGALMGGGGGLVVGAAAGGGFFGPVGAFFGALGGLLAGNLLGSGAYSWYQEQEVRNRQDRRARQYQEFMRQNVGQAVYRLPLYHVPANPEGDLVLDVIYEALPEL